jgi:hypothetical protein
MSNGCSVLVQAIRLETGEMNAATARPDIRSSARIATLESLREHLQWAIELEHFTLPPYLCALYLLDAIRNPEASEAVVSVLVEEMLHIRWWTSAARFTADAAGLSAMPATRRLLVRGSAVALWSRGPDVF